MGRGPEPPGTARQENPSWLSLGEVGTWGEREKMPQQNFGVELGWVASSE